jgi:superfamily II DNA or RNA helicase
MNRTLRCYQVEAIQAVQAEWDRGIVRTSIVAATGTGKTDIIARLAAAEVSAGRRVLCLAHRGELLDQIIERCRLWLRELGQAGTVGRVQAGRNEGQRDIVVASIDTLRGEARRQSMRRPDLVIIDEAHRAPSKGYQAVLRWAGCFRDAEPETDPNGRALPPTRALGVTATMIRGDKLSLGDTWQSCALTRGIEWGVSHGPSGEIVDGALGSMELSRQVDPSAGEIGWLVRPRGLAVVTDMDLGGVKTRNTTEAGGGRDYAKEELGELVAQEAEQIVKSWLEHGEDRTTMAFTPDVASAQSLTAAFLAAGVTAECVTGTTSAAVRRDVKARMERRETRVRVDIMVGTEGFDLPAISCILMARPTKLLGLYTQMLGRGLRRDDNSGKRDCLVLDVVGTSRVLKLTTLVDLLPSAPYDRTEVDALPCESCGGEGGVCTEDCECDRCIGSTGPREDRRRKLIQPRYEEVDLFPTAGMATTLRWMETPKGARFLTVNGRSEDPRRMPQLVVIDQHADDSYSVGVCNVRGEPEGRRVVKGQPLRRAVLIAEAYARDLDPNVDRPYKGAGRATPAQVAALVRLGIASQGDAEWHTGRAASDALELFWAARRLDR